MFTFYSITILGLTHLAVIVLLLFLVVFFLQIEIMHFDGIIHGLYNIFKKFEIFFVHENMKKLPSKVAHNQPKRLFQYCKQAKNQLEFNFFSHKNVSLKQSYATVKIQLRLIKEFSPIFFFTVDASIDII